MGSIVTIVVVIAIVAPSYVFAIHILITEGSGIVVEHVPIAIEISSDGIRFSEALWPYNNGYSDVIAGITINPWATVKGVDDVYIVRVLYVDFVRR